MKITKYSDLIYPDIIDDNDFHGQKKVPPEISIQYTVIPLIYKYSIIYKEGFNNIAYKYIWDSERCSVNQFEIYKDFQ